MELELDDEYDPHDEFDDERDGDVVYGHDGCVLRPTAVLVGEPSEVIGQIYSADSTFDRVKPPKSFVLRILRGLLLGTVIGGWFLLFPILQPGPLDFFWYLITFICITAGVREVWRKTRYEAETTYLGELGIERLRVQGRPDATPSREAFLFDDIAELRISLVRWLMHGNVHVATKFEYNWTDFQQQTVYKIEGMVGAKEFPIEQGHAWHLAQFAEKAWTDFVYGRLQEEYRRIRCMTFVINKWKSILVGDGFLEYRTSGSTERFQVKDLETATLVDGWFTFSPRDSVRFGRSAKIKFRYSELANAQAFIMALDEFLGFDPNDFTETSSSAAISMF